MNFGHGFGEPEVDRKRAGKEPVRTGDEDKTTHFSVKTNIASQSHFLKRSKILNTIWKMKIWCPNEIGINPNIVHVIVLWKALRYEPYHMDHIKLLLQSAIESLKNSEYDYMNNIWVDSDLIWTPNLHFSNRVQDFGPLQEVALRSNIGFDGKVFINSVWVVLYD